MTTTAPQKIDHFFNDPMFEQGMFTYPNLYASMVREFGDGSHFVEIGCWKGQSASFMGVEIHNSGKRIKFDCVDHWSDAEGCPNLAWMPTNQTLFGVFLSNTERVKHIITPVRMMSVDAAKNYEDGSLDFVFIDGDHTREACREDIIAWTPKVKNGGILAGHDYGWCQGVRDAVHDVFGEGNGKFTDRYGDAYSSYQDPWGEGCFIMRISRS